MARSAAVKGTSSWVSTMSAKAVATAANVATHGITCRFCRQASARASTTNATSRAAVTLGGRTWKRTVPSHSRGAKINADVTP